MSHGLKVKEKANKPRHFPKHIVAISRAIYHTVK
jgi:hypothetical protein